MPTPRRNLATSVVGGLIYAVGGHIPGRDADEAWTDAVEAYDPRANTWRKRAPMPQPRGFLGAATLGGKLYAIGGWDWRELFPSVHEYDPATDTWRSRADMPDPRFAFGTAAVDGRIYVIGGQSVDPGPCPCAGWEIVGSVLEYDPVRNRWDARAPMADPRLRLAAVGVGPDVYAIGGSSPDLGVIHDRVEMYDYRRDRWVQKRPMPTARSSVAAAAIGGRVYAVGGRDGAQTVDALEVYDTGLTLPVDGASKAPGVWARIKAAHDRAPADSR